MFRKGTAVLLAACLITLSPGFEAYQVLAAVRIQVHAPVTSIPAGAQAGVGALGRTLSPVSFNTLSLNLASPLVPGPSIPKVSPAMTTGVWELPQAQAVTAPAAHSQGRTAPGKKQTALARFLSQGRDIRAAVQNIGKMDSSGAKVSGRRMMDNILGIRTHAGDALHPAPVEVEIGIGSKQPGLKPAQIISEGVKPAPPSPARTNPGETPLSPTTAAGQLGAAAFTAGLAAAGIIGSKYLASMTLSGALLYAPVAAYTAGLVLAVAAAGFLILGTRIILNRSGAIEAGDRAPMPRPYRFYEKGAIGKVLKSPVTGENPVYIPPYAVWTLKLHTKVRAKAGKTAAFVVQSVVGNTRLIAGEAAALAQAAGTIFKLVRTMSRGDDEVRPFIKEHKKPMLALKGINIVQAVMGVLGSYIVGALVDAAIGKTGGMFSMMLGALIVIALVNIALNTTYEWTKAKVTTLILTDFRVNLFGHILKLPFGFFNREKPSEISARLAVDVAQLSTKNIGIPVILPYYGAMALFAGIMMAITSWQISLMVLAVVPLLTVISVIYGNKAEKLNEAQFDRRAQMISSAEESLSQVRDIRASSTESVEKKRFLGKADSFLGTIMRMVRISASYNGGMGQFYTLAFHTMVLAAGLIAFILTGAPTVGQTMALVGYAAFMRQALEGSLSLYTQFRETSGSARRILEYLKEKPAVEDAPSAVNAGRLQGAVEFKDVTFSYDGVHPVLENINFTAAPGQNVALVGGNASGKSALLDLVGRLDDPNSGTISFDGQDAGALKLSSLRRQISLIHDKGIWIDGMTVRENLTYGLKKETSDSEIYDTLRKAGADFLSNERMFPLGLETRMDADDWRLTTVRKKFMDIARTLLADPTVLLLDRPTGGLNQTESSLVEALLHQLRAGRTSFTVVQRVDEAITADLILVLQEGRIVEKGAHQDLLAAKGVYFKLWLAEQAKDDTQE